MKQKLQVLSKLPVEFEWPVTNSSRYLVLVSSWKVLDLHAAAKADKHPEHHRRQIAEDKPNHEWASRNINLVATETNDESFYEPAQKEAEPQTRNRAAAGDDVAKWM